MKKIVIITLALLFASIGVQVNASDQSYYLGDLTSETEVLIEDLVYTEYVFTEDTDLHQVYNVEIGSASDFKVVTHDLLFGENGQGLSTVLEIAEDYELHNPDQVVYAAINGDYFSGGLPVDFYAKEGNILRVGPYSHSLGKNSFGYDASHNHMIGKVEYGYRINIINESGEVVEYVMVDKINDSLLDGEVGIYTFNNTNKVTGDNIAKLSITFDEISGNYAFPYHGELKTDINEFVLTNEDYSVHYKDFVIAVKGDNQKFQTLKSALTNNSRVSVYPSPTDSWAGIEYIIGGWQVLLDNGTLLPDSIHDGGASLAPRTSIGVKADGTIGLTVIDGRMDSVPGIDLTQLAHLNQDLGYVSALELDGGGSSTFLLRNTETDELEIMNIPSDGSLRNVANAVLIVGPKIEEPVDPEEPEVPTEPETPIDNPTDTDNPDPIDDRNYTWIYIASGVLFASVVGYIVTRKLL